MPWAAEGTEGGAARKVPGFKIQGCVPAFMMLHHLGRFRLTAAAAACLMACAQRVTRVGGWHAAGTASLVHKAQKWRLSECRLHEGTPALAESLLVGMSPLTRC